jgi:hypothetical protein
MFENTKIIKLIKKNINLKYLRMKSIIKKLFYNFKKNFLYTIRKND